MRTRVAGVLAVAASAVVMMGAPAFASAAFDYPGGAQSIPIRLTY